MRVMVLVKADKSSEAGAMPDEKLLTDMGNYNEELAKAGILIAGEGLHPSSRGKRIRFKGNQRTVIDGPFGNETELVAGFWIWKVDSMDTAIEWAKRCPNPMGAATESDLEIRPIFETEDFGESFTPELRKQEEKLNMQINKEKRAVTHKFIPSLWFDNQAEEAANFYVSVFKNSKIADTTYYGEAGAEVSGKARGSVMTVDFEIEGQEFVALNGGPEFSFSPAISFIVNCTTQQEIDELWEKLSSGGEIQQCGWLKDKFGVTWQIVPKILDEMMRDKNPAKAEAVTKAMLQMKKFDMDALKKAYDRE